MSRKQEILRECNRYLDGIRKGSFQTKLSRRNIIRLIVNDLIALKCLPPSISQLKDEHIDFLLQYWQKKQHSVETICNRFAVLRLISKIPSNKHLGLKKKYQAFQKKIDIPHVEHHAVKNAIDLQTEFGLTRLEAFKIDLLSSLEKSNLLIHRNIATNKKDRFIPIFTENQRKILTKRKEIESKSIEPPEKILPYLYKAELIYLGINPTTPFRKLYIKKRYQTLIETKDYDATIQCLLSETGVSSKYKLLPFLKGFSCE